MQNLPIKSLISLGLKALIPVLVLSVGAVSIVNFVSGNKNSTQPKEIAVNVTEVKPVTSMHNVDLGSVLGLSDTPGFIDFCDVAHNVYTVPLATVPSGNLIRNTTYPSMTKCFTSSWGTPPNYSKGCNIDTKECKGWAWRYVCDVNPNVAWAIDEDPNMSDADKMIYFNRHCTKLTGSQSDIGVKFSRMDTPSSSSQFYKLDDVGCGKLVQVDVTTSNCEPNTGQTCGHIDDFLIYYTGICSTPTPTPTPSITPSPTPSVTPTPTPSVTPSPTPSVTPTPSSTPSVTPTPTPSPTPVATLSCKGLSGIAKDANNTEYQLNNLPQNFVGTVTLTCVGESTVLPITSMEITLTKSLNNNNIDQVQTLTGNSIQSTSNSLCSSGSLCFKGDATFNISGEGTYTARSKVCNSENLCLP